MLATFVMHMCNNKYFHQIINTLTAKGPPVILIPEMINNVPYVISMTKNH